MTFNPDIHHRRSIRLKEYDYSSVGAYFVTACTQERLCLFGDIADGVMCLNDAGRMVADWWLRLPDRFPGVAVDEYVVMPNHFHGIITITDNADTSPVGAPPCGCPGFDVSPPCGCPGFDVSPPCGCPPLDSTAKSGRPRGAAPTLGDVIDWFKTMTTNAYIKGVKNADWPPFPGRFWQRNYYERVIRDDAELNGIREYIQCNPANWAGDENFNAVLATICKGNS
jgi:REP element-mobilizing transposase RayT